MREDCFFLPSQRGQIGFKALSCATAMKAESPQASPDEVVVLLKDLPVPTSVSCHGYER